MEKNNIKRDLLRRQIPLLLMVLPGSIFFLIYNYLPMFGVVIAFKKFRYSRKGFIDALLTSEWVGFDNFKFLFQTKDALIITRNTLLYNLSFIIIGTVIAVFIAICLSRLRNRHVSKFYQTGIFLPYFLSWVVVSYFLAIFLNPKFGYFNNILESFGLEKISWYTEQKYWPGILIFMGIWKNTGYSAVIYLASIAGIDKSYFEAAKLDGASEWQQIKYITLPCIMPLVIILTLLSIGRIFNADFGLFYQLPRDSGPLYAVTNVLDTYIYRALRHSGNVGMSAAAGLYQAIVGCTLIMVCNKFVSLRNKERALF